MKNSILLMKKEHCIPLSLKHSPLDNMYLQSISTLAWKGQASMNTVINKLKWSTVDRACHVSTHVSSPPCWKTFKPREHADIGATGNCKNTAV